MGKSFLKNSKGYTLVEMIIVIAIIGVISAASVISLTLISSARAKDAAMLFGSEVETLRSKAMNMTSSSGDYALLLMMVDDEYRIYYGNVDGGIASYVDDSSNYKSLSKRVEIKVKQYTYGSGSNAVTAGGYIVSGDTAITEFDETDEGTQPTDSNTVIITYNKKGICTSGYGEYDFYKKNGNLVARVIVYQNGSIDIR